MPQGRRMFERRRLILMLLAILLGCAFTSGKNRCGCAVASGQNSRKNNPSNRKRAPRLNQTDKAWLAIGEIPHDSVTDALNALNSLSATDSGAAAESYRAAKDQASPNGRQAAALLVAAALERANDASVEDAYKAVVSESANTL